MASETRGDRALLDHITIDHGPAELLTRFFIKADEAAAARGVAPTFGTFDELMAVNAGNLDSWFPITTTFRPGSGGASDANGFVILGRNGAGDIITTQCARLFDWRDSNFKREAESMRFFYADPARDRGPDECCIVNAPEAAEISGRIAYLGGLWFHPDYRGDKRAAIIARVGRAYALAHWGIDRMIGIMMPSSLNKAFDKRTGLRHVTPLSVILRNTPSLPDGDLEMTLVQMTPMDLVDDAFKFLLNFDAQIDGAVGQRRA